MSPAIQYAPSIAGGGSITLGTSDYVNVYAIDAGTVTVLTPSAGKSLFIHSISAQFQMTYAGAAPPTDPGQYLIYLGDTPDVLALYGVPRLAVAGTIDLNVSSVLDYQIAPGDTLQVGWETLHPANITTTLGNMVVIFGEV